MLTKLISRTASFFRQSSLIPSITYRFSAEEASEVKQQVHVEKKLDKSANFYRNSIRRINVDKEGRGKFTEYHLARLTKLTERSNQVPLLFEAYYNYLGHFTVISSKVVDGMLQKVMRFSDPHLDSVLEVFSNHYYLAYFPHYQITQRLIKLAEKDEETFKKLLVIFLNSPLIKFNKQIVDHLLTYIQGQSSNESLLSTVSKLLMHRSANNLINNQISSSELLKQLSVRFEKILSNRPFKAKNYSKFITEFVEKIEQTSDKSEEHHYQTAVLGLTYGNRHLFYSHLNQLKESKNMKKLLQYVQNCYEPYYVSLTNYLQSQQLSEVLGGLFKQMKASRPLEK